MRNLSGDNWQRYGQGKIVQYFATDVEVYSLLKNHLPMKYGPYSLLWEKSIQNGNKYRYESVENELDAFLDLLSQGVWKFFLRSKVLTPEGFSKSSPPQDWSWSFSGLINIQQERLRQGKQEWSGLGIVDRARNKHTSEIVIHEGYLEIFNLMKKALRKQLVYNTKSLRPDGIFEESKSIRMTEVYADFCRSHPEKSTVQIAK